MAKRTVRSREFHSKFRHMDRRGGRSETLAIHQGRPVRDDQLLSGRHNDKLRDGERTEDTDPEGVEGHRDDVYGTAHYQRVGRYGRIYYHLGNR